MTADDDAPVPWLLWLDGARSAIDNMAVDEALLAVAAGRRTVVLRVYGWRQRAVSIGCFQSHRIIPAGIEGVRRLTGGGLVEHGDDLTYTLAVPADHAIARDDREHSYAWIHEAVAVALATCAVAAIPADESTPRTVDRATMACFVHPSRYDLLDALGKRAGAAQRRTAEGILHQGSIRLLTTPRADLAAALPPAFAKVFGCAFAPLTPLAPILAAAATLAASRYGSPEWLARR